MAWSRSGVADAVAVDDADVGERATVIDVDQPGHGAPSGLGVIDATDGRTVSHGAQRTRNRPALGRRAPWPAASPVTTFEAGRSATSSGVRPDREDRAAGRDARRR